MIIMNNLVAVSVKQDGSELELIDQVRGTVWSLDESSIQWGGCITHNDYPTDEGVSSLKPMRPVSAREEDNHLVVTCDAGGFPVVYTYLLLSDGVEVRLSPPDSKEIEALSMPGSFFPVNERMEILLPIMQGMLWDGRGENLSHMRRSGSHTGFSMQMFGVLGKSGGLLAAAETAIDSLWWYQKDDRGFRVQNVQDSSLGEMRYERVMRYYLTDPGIVPVAKRYRTYVKDKGGFSTWEEKIAVRPNLERLFGSLMCYIGYCHDDLDYVAEFQKLKDDGFDRVLAYPVDFSCHNKDFLMGGLPPIHLSREDIAQITCMGFDVCPWTWINEAIDDHTPERANMYRITRCGERVFGWQIDDSIIHSWWEPHNYNSMYFNRAVGPDLFEYGGGRTDLQAAADALMGSPPDVFPFGAQYAWTGRGSETITYRFRFEDPLVQYALTKAKPVAALHRRIGMLEMTHFEILSEDGWVQRSTFSDGTTVIANFGFAARYDIPDIAPIQGQSWLAV